MPRWPADSRRRLVDAATLLFGDRGYADTTVEQIADAAGVTPRTFFRHFPDKEEVLFADDDALLPALIEAISAPRPPYTAERLMQHALGTLADLLEPERDRLRRRHAIIESDVALTGRDLAKQASWQPAIAGVLAERGFTRDDADVLAAIGFAVFRRAMVGWLTDDDPRRLRDRVERAIPVVREVLDIEVEAGPASSTAKPAEG